MERAPNRQTAQDTAATPRLVWDWDAFVFLTRVASERNSIDSVCSRTILSTLDISRIRRHFQHCSPASVQYTYLHIDIVQMDYSYSP